MLSQDEIRGDWSNLKGTEYHLVYALWLLLREEASEVAFYEGNDLRAEPIRPPTFQGEAGSPGADEAPIRDLALGILKTLCDTEPVALAALKAELEVELAYGSPNRHTVRRIANQLIGAMLSDAAAGPGKGGAYDVKWLNEVAGPGVKSDKPFDRDEGLGCDAAVARALPSTWNGAYYAPRPRLQSLLHGFLASGECLLVLLGKGGTGKTWAVASWTAQDLAHCKRLFLPASILDIAQTLDGVVASALSRFTGAFLKDEEYLDRFRAAPAGRDGPRPVVVVDDLQPSQSTADLLRRQLARLTRRASDASVKLVVTCQTDTWELYQLWRDIPSAEIFSVQPTASEERPGFCSSCLPLR